MLLVEAEHAFGKTTYNRMHVCVCVVVCVCACACVCMRVHLCLCLRKCMYIQYPGASMSSHCAGHSFTLTLGRPDTQSKNQYSCELGYDTPNNASSV